jgi:hypothetical protein
MPNFASRNHPGHSNRRKDSQVGSKGPLAISLAWSIVELTPLPSPFFLPAARHHQRLDQEGLRVF